MQWAEWSLQWSYSENNREVNVLWSFEVEEERMRMRKGDSWKHRIQDKNSPFQWKKKVKGNSYYGRSLSAAWKWCPQRQLMHGVRVTEIRCTASSETVKQFETDVNFCSHLVQAHCKPSEREIQRRGWATGLQRKNKSGDEWQSCKSLQKRIVVALGWKRPHKNRPDTKQSFMNRKEDKRKESAWHRRQMIKTEEGKDLREACGWPWQQWEALRWAQRQKVTANRLGVEQRQQEGERWEGTDDKSLKHRHAG